MSTRSKYLVFMVLTVLIAASVVGISLYGSNVAANSYSPDSVKPTYVGIEYEIKVFNGTVVSVTSEGITIESDEYSGVLLTNGSWIYIDSELIRRGNWSEVFGQVGEGDALIAMISIERDDGELNILLGLRQDDLILLRTRVLKHSTVRCMHTRNYFGLYGEITYKGENYMVIKRNGYNIMMIVGQESKWYKAGYGVVTWSDVRDEFKDGDTIRVFYHNILVLNNKLADYLGFKAIIWGYSGSIIDLDTGTALMRYLG